MPLIEGEAALSRAAQALAEGQLVAFPTETVYGLGARADDDAAVARIYAAKGRPAWDDSRSDLSALRLAPRAQLARALATTSPHNVLAAAELRRKIRGAGVPPAGAAAGSEPLIFEGKDGRLVLGVAAGAVAGDERDERIEVRRRGRRRRQRAPRAPHARAPGLAAHLSRGLAASLLRPAAHAARVRVQ